MDRDPIRLNYESFPREPTRSPFPWVWCGIGLAFLLLLAGGFFGVPEWIANAVPE